MEKSSSISDYLQNVLLIEIPVVVELAQVNVTVSDLLKIAPGTLIPTGQRVADAVTITANGVPIATGAVSTNLAGRQIQVTEILSAKTDITEKRAA